MGWLRKVTGIQAQINAAKANAANSIAALKATQQATVSAQVDQARTATEQQAAAIARESAISKANDMLDVPMETADVQVEATGTESAAAASRRKRGQFGRDWYSGVQL